MQSHRLFVLSAIAAATLATTTFMSVQITPSSAKPASCP